MSRPQLAAVALLPGVDVPWVWSSSAWFALLVLVPQGARS